MDNDRRLTSPAGWYCGCLEVIRNNSISDAGALSSIHGLPITSEWLNWKKKFQIRTNAQFVLVVEKEGIYCRLSEDRFFEKLPCILVTGKGFPDLATRAFVWTLHKEFDLPIIGICDCNPFGILVLYTYFMGSSRLGVDGRQRYSVPIQWLGLRPSQLETLRGDDCLPSAAFQALTELDRKKLAVLCNESHQFHAHDEDRLDELHRMQELGYKAELEALQWMGMDYLSSWAEHNLRRYFRGDVGYII